jgi:hypothetical protein
MHSILLCKFPIFSGNFHNFLSVFIPTTPWIIQLKSMSSDEENAYCTVEEVFDGPIDNFVFRQCPAEFKLKAQQLTEGTQGPPPSWTSNSPPKSSLIQISHSKGIIMFPHPENGTRL